MPKTRKFTPAAPNELQIDADKWPWRLSELLGAAVEGGHLKLKSLEITPSKEPGHYHVRIFLSKPIDLMEKVALQTILGSDRWRELKNWMRVKNKAPYPVLFLENDI